MGINISLASCRDNVRKASKLLGKKETEHKWSCTTPMSWPKKVIKKSFWTPQGVHSKTFSTIPHVEKNSRCVVFSGTIECRGKVSTKYRKLELSSTFQVQAGNTVISTRAWRDNVLSIYKEPVSYVSNIL